MLTDLHSGSATLLRAHCTDVTVLSFYFTDASVTRCSPRLNITHQLHLLVLYSETPDSSFFLTTGKLSD